MPTLERVLVTWSGQQGLPGVSVFYGAGIGSATADLSTFFNAIKAGFTNTLTWSFPSSGDTIDDATGTLNGAWSATPTFNTVTGTATGNFAAGCGGYIKWDTGAIIGGRRLKGRTFLTNLSSAMYQSDGTIDNGIVSVWQTAANTLVSAGSLAIWHRPSPGGANGASDLVASAQVPDQVTSLRSRRR